MYDLIVKGGRVLDPAQNIDAMLDVAVKGHKIAALAKNIPANESRQVIDASGKLVTPGLIDSHCHVFNFPGSDVCGPDVAGVNQGVTTIVDAGSAGQADFNDLPEKIIPASRTTVFGFLHLSSHGLKYINDGAEPKNWNDIDMAATAAVIDNYREIIKGIKIRMVGEFVGSTGILPTTISTDLSARSIAGPVYGMTVTMSKLLALGVSLRKIIDMSTISPACAIGIADKKGGLRVGMDADISILELLSGKWVLEDSQHETITTNTLITPKMCIKSGQPIPAKPAYQPQPSG
jgi:predicted amidohydrolase